MNPALGLIMIVIEEDHCIKVYKADIPANGLSLNLVATYDKSNFRLEELLAQNRQYNYLVLDYKKAIKSGTFITSESARPYISNFLKDDAIKIIPAPERINLKGEIETALTEPEINIILREVFNSNNKQVSIILLNSIFNPCHEKILQNVLKVAGYKVDISSDAMK